MAKKSRAALEGYPALKSSLLGTFDGVTDVARHIINTKRADGAGNSSETLPSGRDWDMNMNMNMALAFASDGGHWEAGANLLQAARVDIDRMQTRAPALERVRSVAGHSPCVPSFLAGIPQAMWADAEPEDFSTMRSKVLRIGVVASYSAFATSENIQNRGAAVMSVVDGLEAEGFRVEVAAVIVAADDYTADCYRWDVLIKQADQDWNPGRVAFALAHPAFNRRLAFAVKERSQPAFKNTTQGGYNSIVANRIDGSDYDIWLPRLCQEGCKQFDTRKTSAEQVVAMINSVKVAA